MTELYGQDQSHDLVGEPLVQSRQRIKSSSIYAILKKPNLKLYKPNYILPLRLAVHRPAVEISYKILVSGVLMVSAAGNCQQMPLVWICYC